LRINALVTKQISHADESIRIQIENADDVQAFMDKLKAVLSITDARANLHMQHLAEDTELTTNLSSSEHEAFLTAAQILYPDKGVHNLDTLGGQVKFEFSKINAQGETLTLQLLDVGDVVDLNTMLTTLQNLIDNRLQETNQRELDHMRFIRTLDMNTQVKIGMVLDILYGRAFKEEVLKRLKSEDTEAQNTSNQASAQNASQKASV